jgi:hypothetical protein
MPLYFDESYKLVDHPLLKALIKRAKAFITTLKSHLPSYNITQIVDLS